MSGIYDMLGGDVKSHKIPARKHEGRRPPGRSTQLKEIK
jgi:hypothetical protein